MLMIALSCLILAAVISISDLGANTLYHVRLTQLTDYYDPEMTGERPGEFVGRGAELLGLHGVVTRDSFKALMNGIHPESKAKLVKNAGSKSRAAAWDICHSPDKSFSILWALAEPAERLELEAAFCAAVESSILRIEKATSIRTGREGIPTPASPVISRFVHTSAREPYDPQLHAHLVVHNVGVADDGRTGAIVSKPLYQQKMMLGALFRCDLAYELGRQFPRMEFRQTEAGFEIVGVPEHVRAHFSSRRQQMADELGELGSESASAKAFAALATRSAKESVPPLTTLERRWRADADRLGFTQLHVHETLHRSSRFAHKQDGVLEKSFGASLDKLSAKHSHFGQFDITRMVADAAVAKG
ncbi:MAG: relaxase domain-containing protein, partial [Planctomycetales bacterium]|nr:relaxase domain-containing protein [Planctomycetales bacterium]